MAEGIGEILTYAIGVAISPVPIIAVILMLFSARARVNGPMFLAGWVVALGVVSAVAYALADAGDAATDEHRRRHDLLGARSRSASSSSSLAARQWRGRPAPGRAAGDAEVDGGHRRVLARSRRSRSRCCSPG